MFRFIVLPGLLFVCIASAVVAGDSADGDVRYDIDFATPHSAYEMASSDREWASTLARRFGYKGKIVYFVATTLPIRRAGTEVRDVVYRRTDQPQYYYVSEGDVMFDLKRGKIYNPGVGGFSMHAPRSRRFIACFQFQPGGVPFIRHPPIKPGAVWWYGDPKWNRLDLAK